MYHQLCRRIIVVLSSSLALTSCSMFGPVQTAPQHTYVINTVPCHVATKRRSNLSIVVNLPEVNSVYNTTEMAYSKCPHQVSFYSKSAWAAVPGQMIQPLIVHTLQNTHHFHAVNQAPSVAVSDYLLSTQVYELIQDFQMHPSMERITLRAQIIRSGTGQVVATKEFTAMAPAYCDDPNTGALAANHAMEEILRRLAGFVVRKI